MNAVTSVLISFLFVCLFFFLLVVSGESNSDPLLKLMHYTNTGDLDPVRGHARASSRLFTDLYHAGNSMSKTLH